MAGRYSAIHLHFFEKSVELLTDLMSQMPTRRHFKYYLTSSHFVTKVKMTALYNSEEGHLFKKLVDNLSDY